MKLKELLKLYMGYMSHSTIKIINGKDKEYNIIYCGIVKEAYEDSNLDVYIATSIDSGIVNDFVVPVIFVI